MGGNIVKLVFETFAHGSGFDDIITGGSNAQNTLNQLSGAARTLGNVFGPLGGIIGSAFGAFLQGNIWQVAALGVNFLFKRMGWLQDATQKATTYFDDLKKAIEEFASASERAFGKAVSFQDKQQKKYAEELDSVNALKKAELELARERERANGGTGSAQDAAISALDEKGARDKAEDAVYRAGQRVDAAQKRMDDADAAIEYEKKNGANTGHEDRMKTLLAERKAAREALEDEKLKLEIAQRAQDALEKSQKAAHLKAVNDAKEEADAKVEAKAKADEEASRKKEEENKKDADEFVNAYAEDQEKERKREEQEQKKAEEKRLQRELDANKKRADDLQRRMEDALKNAETAREDFAKRGDLDLGGEEQARRMGAANDKRLKDVAKRLTDKGIDIDNPGRRLSREEEAARRWMLQEREKDKAAQELKKQQKVMEDIKSLLEKATEL